MNKGISLAILAVSLTAAVFALPIANSQAVETNNNKGGKIDKSSTVITESSTNQSSEQQETQPQNDETVTFIVTINGDSLLDTVIASNGKYKNVSDLILSNDGKSYYDTIKKNQAVVKASIQKTVANSDFTNCYTYIAAINGFTVKAPYSSFDKISKIKDVKSVLISTNTTKTETQETDVSASSVSQNMINASYGYKNGYTGKKMLIAIIDDSFDCSQEAFSSIPDQVKYNKSDIDEIYNAVKFNTKDNITSSDIYKNNKIVYSYDYAENDNDTYCADMYHGTHVAGIAAGNNGLSGSKQFRGVAYDAQLALMKVCEDNKNEFSDDAIISALDDAAKIGADVVNCSYGDTKVPTMSNVFNSIYQKLSDSGVYVVTSAGNESYNTSSSENKTLNSSFIDYSTIAYPSSLSYAFSVGSVNSSKYESNYFKANNQNVECYDVSLMDTQGKLLESTKLFSDKIVGKTNYIFLNNIGDTGDYKNIDVKGKIVIVNRGTISFQKKLQNAYDNGAVGLIIINSSDENIIAGVDNCLIPAVMIHSSYKSYFVDNPKGTIIPQSEKTLFDDKSAGKIANFSSYGVTADLKLKPEIVAPGTNIYSCVNNNKYEALSGTSMSSPCICGVAAIIRQYIQSTPTLKNMTLAQQNNYISSLIMSTADVLKYTDDNTSNETLYYTPRLQGAGMVNLQKALSSKAYLTVSGSNEPKADLGDSENGSYSFTFTVNNTSDKAVTYGMSSAVQTDKALVQDDGSIINTLTPVSLLKNTDVSMTVNGKKVTSVTVSSNSSVDIQVSVNLDTKTALTYTKYFPNGFYVDGYVFLKSSDKSATALNLPFMGFCGDWSKISIFDSTIYESTPSITNLDNYLSAVAEDNGEFSDYELGYNYFTGEISSDNIYIGNDTVKNYYDNNKMSSSFLIPNFNMLRDACNYTISISDQNGKSLFSENYGTYGSYINKDTTRYNDMIENFDMGSLRKLFSTLSEGRYTYTISANSIDVNGKVGENNIKSYNFTVDNTVPKALGSKTYIKDGKTYLDISAYDNDKIQGFDLFTANYNDTTKSYEYADSIDQLIEHSYIDKDTYKLVDTKTSDNGTVTYTYDITNLQAQLNKLGTYCDNQSEAPSTKKIVYKVRDYAYNTADPQTADTVAYGSIKVIIKDQNGNGVSNVVLSLNGQEQTTSQDGSTLFEDICPNTYNITVISSPNNYEFKETVFKAIVSNSSLDVVQNITVKYNQSSENSDKSKLSDDSNQLSTSVASNTLTSSKVSEISNNNGNSENTSSSISESYSSNSNDSSDTSDDTTAQTGDNSLYAVIFVGTLLAISIASFLVSRQRSNR